MSTGKDQSPVIRLVDIAAQAREVYGEQADEVAGRKLPTHEWRFEVCWEGSTALMHLGATADHVAAYIRVWREHKKAVGLVDSETQEWL